MKPSTSSITFSQAIQEYYKKRMVKDLEDEIEAFKTMTEDQKMAYLAIKAAFSNFDDGYDS